MRGERHPRVELPAPRLVGLAAWRGVGELYNSDGLTHAASIAYYALLSLFPFALLVLSVLGAMTADTADRDCGRAFVFRYFPRQFEFITGQLDAFRASTLTSASAGIARRWSGPRSASSTPSPPP